jgi:hypothetical protein
MTDIVLALGVSGAKLDLITTEMSRLANPPVPVPVFVPMVLEVPEIFEWECARSGVCDTPNVIGYILPPENQREYESDEGDYRDWRSLLHEIFPLPEEEHGVEAWKARFREMFSSDDVKELELCAYANGNGQFWLDGLVQLMNGGPEPDDTLDDDAPLADWERELLDDSYDERLD